MKTDVKDLSYCPHGRHIVPREHMTKILADDGKTWRRGCEECKSKDYELRASNAKGRVIK